MITLTTSVYEKDFRYTLNNNSWFYNFEHPFVTKKNIIVNNIDNIEEFLELKKEFDGKFNFFNHEEYIDEINKKFNLNLNLLDPHLFYSIQHYTNILTNSNEYSFFVGPDCTIVGNDFSNFFTESISLFESDKTVVTTTLFWADPTYSTSSFENEENSYGINKKNDLFCFSKVFSDQVYFYKKDNLISCDFTNIDSLHRFPIYAKNTFEMRLTNYLITNDNYRGIFKSNLHYIHKSF